MKEIIKSIRYSLFSPMPESRKTEHRIKDKIRKIRYMLFGHLPILGRRRRPGETMKAKGRRKDEEFFDKYCQGQGLDIGYGGDLIVKAARGWDFEHGDAHYLNGLDDESFDFVYSSHLLEHLPDCEQALKNWWRVLKPGGYLILYLPHRDLYERKMKLPSRYNDDHAHFFLPEEEDLPDTKGIVPLVGRALSDHDIVYCKVCDQGYKNPGVDLPSEGEYSIEIVVKKISV